VPEFPKPISSSKCY